MFGNGAGIFIMVLRLYFEVAVGMIQKSIAKLTIVTVWALLVKVTGSVSG